MIGSKAYFSAVVAVVACGVSVASAQMSFNLTNGGGATPQMMAGFQEAGAMWGALFTDPITINVRVNAASLAVGAVGHTETYYDPYTYTSVRAALVNGKQSADDFSSSSKLQAGPAISMLINRTANNPNGVVSATPYFDTGLGGPGQAGTENNSTIRVTSANAKALGLILGNTAGLDGIVTFSNLAIFDFDRSNGISATKVDFVGAAVHELGHLMGFVSGVDVLVGNGAAPGLADNKLKFVTPLDLFRFSSRSIGTGGDVGVIDWADDSTKKYFSVDGGVTEVSEFSTGATYEASHWKYNMGLGLMGPTAGAGNLLSLSSNDIRAFDVMGYDLAVPEPSTAALLGAACVGGLVWGRRRRVRRG